MLENKNILLTGGTGSFGKVFTKKVVERYKPSRLVIYSRDELKQYEMKNAEPYRNMDCLRFIIGDIRDRERLSRVMDGIDYVIHAAALKQVPACEYFPTQAVLTNCLGPANIVRAIEENGYPVDTVIAVSTDKACKPVNVMGMTKSIQERIITTANILNPNTL